MDISDPACALCQRERELTFHHLIPRKVHKRPFFKKNYTRDELRQGIEICQICHSGLHRIHDEKTLAKELSTLEALRRDEAVQKHVQWARKQKR